MSADTMQNYKGYFPEDNPCNLQKKIKQKTSDIITMESRNMIDDIKIETKAKK